MKTHKAPPQTCRGRLWNLSGPAWARVLLQRQQRLLQLLPRRLLHFPLLGCSARAVLGVPRPEWAHAPNLGWAAVCPAGAGGHPRWAAVPPLQRQLGGHAPPQHDFRQQPTQPGFPAPPRHSRGLCRPRPPGQRRAVKSNDYIKKTSFLLLNRNYIKRPMFLTLGRAPASISNSAAAKEPVAAAGRAQRLGMTPGTAQRGRNGSQRGPVSCWFCLSIQTNEGVQNAVPTSRLLCKQTKPKKLSDATLQSRSKSG